MYLPTNHHHYHLSFHKLLFSTRAPTGTIHYNKISNYVANLFIFSALSLKLKRAWPHFIALSISGLLPCGWPQMTPAWPWTPSMRYTLAMVFPTKFGDRVAFLSNLIRGWPLHYLCNGLIDWLTLGWSLHGLWPQECIILPSGVSPTKVGGHELLLKQLDFWMTFGQVTFNICSWASGAHPYPHAKFQPHTLKHNKMHSQTHRQTPPTHTPTQAPLF